MNRHLAPILGGLLLTSSPAAAQQLPAYDTGGTRINVARNAAVVSRVTAAGGAAATDAVVVAGALPPGMSLGLDGAINGVSMASGDHGFRVRVTGTGGVAGESDLLLTVNPATLQGTVQSFSFVSATTGLTVPYSIYLPPEYASGDARFPVVFHLHGINGSHQGGQLNTVPRSLEAARASGVVRPLILVFPDGFRDSFWADSANSAKPAETHLLDLLAHVDAQFRAVADARFRVAGGFSMGGFGAAKLATKYPDRFATGVLYDGALLTWAQVQQRHPQQAAEIFDGSAARFDQHSPWHWLAQNTAALAGPTRLRSAAGALVNENRAWRDAVVAAGVAMDYVETGLPHTVGRLFDAQGANTWIFIEQRLDAADRVFDNGLEPTTP